jgi:hypothetical protein
MKARKTLSLEEKATPQEIDAIIGEPFGSYEICQVEAS